MLEIRVLNLLFFLSCGVDRVNLLLDILVTDPELGGGCDPCLLEFEFTQFSFLVSRGHFGWVEHLHVVLLL
jgi:hypothetical protein